MQMFSHATDVPSEGSTPETSPWFQDRGPLSLGQEAMWFLNQLSGADQAYIVQSTFRVEAGLDLARLEAALRALVRRHAALRTLFVNTDDGPVQCVLEPEEAAQRFQLLRMAGPPSQPDERTLARQIAERVGQPFRVDRELPLRALCIELGDGATILALRAHHLVSDGLSMGILHRELVSIYGAGGDASGLPPAPATLLDAARRQRAVAAGEAWESQRGYWREELAGVQDLQLATDRPRAVKSDFQAGFVRVEIDAGLVEGLRGLARASGTSRFRAWLALFQVLLARMASQSDFAVGIPVGGRKDPALRDTVGMFINTLAIRLPQGFDGMGFDLLLRAADAKIRAAIEHSDYPFEKVVADTVTDRSFERNPVYQAYFSFENLPDRWDLKLPSLACSALMLPLLHTNLDLMLEVEEHEHGGATGMWQYRTDLFDEAMVERMARRFDVLLRSVVASPETPIGELAWYDAAEREQVLSTWNASEVDYRIEGGVASWLRARADAVPEATALVFGDASMSYLELDRLSEHWAVRLRAAGVGPEVIVGLGMRRGFGLVVGLLAVVKAGGAFMPLDPDYPAQRLRQMLEDADAPVLLSDAGSARMFAELAPSARVLVVEADGGPVPEGAVERLADEAGPQDLAYVIFTSGSTGRPKGAMNLQRGLANDLLWYHHRVLGFRSEDRVLQSTSISFDPSIWQILGTLAFGATLVLPPPGLERDVDALALEVGRRGITILTLVPSLLRALLAAPGFRAPVPLRYMLCGGEALDSDLAGQFLHAFPGVRLGNFYGPSEASCDSAWQEVALPLEPRAIVPIGRPTANVKLYVLDDRGRPLPCGVAGELSVGGVGVGRGYLKRPELTAERFVDDPWHAGGRLYRTGDRVRWLADGRLEFLGRLDTQVKLRGQRVELGEIEAALYACAGVREAAVVTHGQAQALALVAYVVAPGGGIDDLRAELAAGLPAYMVPAAFVALDALPRLPNGKLDRRALPEPSFEAREPDSSGPRSGVEATLLEIWRGVLSKAKTIGTRSNFFELGGDSLSATLVVSRVRSTFGVDVPLSTMFDHPTIAGLAEVLEGNWPQWSTEAMTAVDRGGPL
ncbi:non-ribosomal peptide synthetase, partial [Thiomonas sp. FB-6]|uniref:non-ribosomal peptide synthetase n=1 Tax=Thiomonas sp. FB-6 TaxID=1158291 RepID=UPI00037F7A62